MLSPRRAYCDETICSEERLEAFGAQVLPKEGKRHMSRETKLELVCSHKQRHKENLKQVKGTSDQTKPKSKDAEKKRQRKPCLTATCPQWKWSVRVSARDAIAPKDVIEVRLEETRPVWQQGIMSMTCDETKIGGVCAIIFILAVTMTAFQ